MVLCSARLTAWFGGKWTNLLVKESFDYYPVGESGKNLPSLILIKHELFNHIFREKMSKSSKKKPSKKSKQPELSVINPHAAGIDLGSREHWACVPSSSTESTNIQPFGCTTPDLIALADWFTSGGVTTVAMESTGVEWIPLFHILSARNFKVFLVNSKTVKTVPGRKSDVLDCQWLQQLHSYGLLAPYECPRG